VPEALDRLLTQIGEDNVVVGPVTSGQQIEARLPDLPDRRGPQLPVPLR
jgi:hypothetical protein